MNFPTIKVYRTAWAWLIHCGWCDGLAGVETSEERANTFVTAHLQDEAHVIAKFKKEMETL